MDLGLIEGILKVQSAYIYIYRWLGGGKLGNVLLGPYRERHKGSLESF